MPFIDTIIIINDNNHHQHSFSSTTYYYYYYYSCCCHREDLRSWVDKTLTMLMDSIVPLLLLGQVQDGTHELWRPAGMEHEEGLSKQRVLLGEQQPQVHWGSPTSLDLPPPHLPAEWWCSADWSGVDAWSLDGQSSTPPLVTGSSPLEGETPLSTRHATALSHSEVLHEPQRSSWLASTLVLSQRFKVPDDWRIVNRMIVIPQ